MTTPLPTRRSPRSIKALCNGILIPGHDYELTATFLSLAHCSGWSADHIGNVFKDLTGTDLCQELVWDIYFEWVHGRDMGEDITRAEWEIMHCLMKAIGRNIERPGRPLSQTARPRTINFETQWCAKNVTGIPIFPGYTANVRAASRAFLQSQTAEEAFGILTPFEGIVLAKFGENTLYIVRKALKNWAEAMWNHLRSQPDLRAIRERDHVDLIMFHLKEFHTLYEDRFGKMDTWANSALGEIREDTVYIKSTGYGVKVVLGLLMADRMQVIQKKRQQRREMIGFVEVDGEQAICPVCQDPLGIQCPEGRREVGVRLVACCHQIIGVECLRTWLNQLLHPNKFHDSCPTCRYQFPEVFLRKIFSVDEYAARVVVESRSEYGSPLPEPDHAAGVAVGNQRELISPSPEPEIVSYPIRSQQEQDALLQQYAGRIRYSEESEMMVFEDDDLLAFDYAPLAGSRDAVRHANVNQVELGEAMNDDFEMEG